MSSVFVWLARRGSAARRRMAAELAARPLRVYRSRPAAFLSPAMPVPVDCEPDGYRQLIREWPDRDTAEQLTEALHRIELERAAQPPVIEVTVTTPPGGIPRADLARLVQARMAETGILPEPLPPPEPAGALPAYRHPSLDETQVIPPVRGDDGTEIIEVRVP